MGYYISTADAARLKTYTYSGIDKSFLSRYVLSRYWNWLVQWFPLWFAYVPPAWLTPDYQYTH